jgi:hypothetical protein
MVPKNILKKPCFSPGALNLLENVNETEVLLYGDCID